MRILFVIPEIRLNDKPYHFPFWAGILGSIIKNKGGQVAILDLNAMRMDYGGKLVPTNVILEEISSENWDLIGIGGLTTTYSRIKQLVHIIKKASPDSLLVGGGGWSTYNPDEILQLIPQIDMICIGGGEETFSELYDHLEQGKSDFEKINGLCIRKNETIVYTPPRALISDLDQIPYPAYDLFELETYFKYSGEPMSVESFNAKRRASTVWERGCPRGCTFCSHNGMSRIDLQNIFGKGDRRDGEKIVRMVDKENDTFQLPARWPTPRYAVNNIKYLKDEYDVDFVSILDENMTCNLKWTAEFCQTYKEEGLHETVKWGTLGDAPSVAVKPEIVKVMKDAGCSYISFGFESASDKVLNEDIQKGQTKIHLQKTVDAMRDADLTPLATFMMGNPHENINDLLETTEFWIKNGIVVDPFICTPYVGSPLFYNNRDFILEQYDNRLSYAHLKKSNVPESKRKEWELQSLDKFMKDCGDATEYTATVSKYFTIPELIGLKRLMYNQDLRRMLQWAHQRYDQTGLDQWKHDEKWDKYCDICISRKEMSENFSNLEITTS